jgi:integrase
MENPLSPPQTNLLASLAALPPDELRMVAMLIDRLLPPKAIATAAAGDTTTTLVQFFEAFGEPVLLRQRRKADEKTIRGYRDSMHYWRSITGDPPLATITDETLAQFVTALEAMPGRKGTKLSGHTVAKHARHVQMILYRCGPRRPGIKHCQGLIAEVPQFGTIDRPRPDCAGDFTPAELGAMWTAAPTMTSPTNHGATPGEFWRGLLALGYFGMYRIHSMLTLGMADVDEAGWVEVRCEHAKRGHGYRNFLPKRALEAIAWGDPQRSLVLPGVSLKCQSNLRKSFNALQMRAGIARHECRGFHGLRKAGGTALARIDPLAAQMQLGHSGGTVLQAHYLSRNQLLAEAVDKMPWPFGEDAA